MKIAFFDTKPYDSKFFEELNQSFGYKIKYFEYKLSEETARMAEGYEVVCAFVNDNLNKEVMDILYDKGVKLIAMRCAGYNNVDFKAAYGKIHVVRVPAYSPYAIAEHAFALIMALNRKTHRAFNRTRDNNFSINTLMGFDLHGKTMGVIGTGKIGQVFINICKGFGMNVIAYDKFPNEKLEVAYTSLENIYKSSDIISLHCPLTKETYHMIDEASIAMMKEGVMLINTSRGGLIDGASLIEGLKIRKIGSAGLDVYEEESDYFFEDYSDEILNDDILARILSFTNVLVTSHQAFFTKEALYKIAQTTLENIKEFDENNKVENEICYNCTNKNDCQKNITGKCF